MFERSAACRSGSDVVVVCESEGCSGGSGGTPSILPLRLPARLLIEGCLLLLAVDGLEESFVPCLSLDRGAPSEAERLASLSKEVEELPPSGVRVLPLRLLFRLLVPLLLLVLVLLLTLFVGNGGKAQS